jgi:hypothetical protein
MIYILEDNDERVRQFTAASALIAPEIPVRIWRSAHQMMQDLVDGLEHAQIISLDHDLNRLSTDADDPGTGYDVAKFLGELIPCCPIIIHTSNGDRGNWMVGELSRGGWTYDRVYPAGDEWIANDWARTLRKYLRQKT